MSRGTIKFLTLMSHKQVEKGVLEADSLKNSLEYLNMKEHLIQTLSNGGMNTKIHFFGSRVIGLAHKKSDLDIYVEYNNNFYSDKNVERDRMVLEKIASLIEIVAEWKIETKILNASFPIIEVLHIPTSIKCDISVSNGLGVANSLMMAYLFDLQPEAKKFYHFMKIFLIRYRDYFEGYLLKLLVIFFLQNEKVFPSIKLIQDNLPITYINGWPTVTINTERNISYYRLENMENYKIYIQKFSSFYSNFQYSKYVMSTYDAEQILRTSYKYPEEIEGHTLCIFGPLNRKHNIGKYLPEACAENFVFLCGSLVRLFNQRRIKKYIRS